MLVVGPGSVPAVGVGDPGMEPGVQRQEGHPADWKPALVDGAAVLCPRNTRMKGGGKGSYVGARNRSRGAQDGPLG